MRHLFLNGPVQSGPFTFDARPGKAVGIRLAAALNAILGAPPAPHLWNTATLAGDLRHREADGSAISRRRFEADLIAGTYPSGQPPAGGVMTDADAEVADLALEVIENNLRVGTLGISRETVPTCRTCGHMTGTGGHPCRACGSTDSRKERAGLHLVAEPARDRPVLDRSDIHASHRRQPKHLQHTAGAAAGRLILSRTRDHGIDLAPLGLHGLVLDPRAGVHVTVLTAARRHLVETAVMTVTPNAVNHIAAHGRYFREHDGTRLRYALHGHLPYGDLADLHPLHEAYRAAPEAKDDFAQWFLPLFALTASSGTRSGRLPGLFTYYMRARLARPDPVDATVLEAVRCSVRAGRTDWVMVGRVLAVVMAGR
ncbi:MULTISPECIES: hypothetical protein [Kitasatospora]|uniref:Uncharacterized protein n=1 Tax=Kitasatospora setae (strain ATCC 33774 / DSM 43861 / JCM 3304 / KCC A-0304 / NBRC 14216 / KM-6054) TaxID=452652 RepID=E4N6R2_KITSK|nr:MULTISPECIES: hypothetical protein [Kitasatospora]BAJ26893.1 hypothetical protein KSE_10590 [Kitasatospora setae KM-6054]